MTRIVWTQEAISDLESVRDFIGRTSPHYGNVVAARLVEAMDRVRDFPRSGRPGEEGVSLTAFLTTVVQILRNADIPFMLTGSLAAAYYGTPRATQDVDVVIDLGPAQWDP